jgi:hypothetical protein
LKARRSWYEAHRESSKPYRAQFSDTCQRGHALSGSNVRASAKGYRYCHECKLTLQRERRSKAIT